MCPKGIRAQKSESDNPSFFNIYFYLNGKDVESTFSPFPSLLQTIRIVMI